MPLQTALDPDFARRWATWEKRGRKHDRLMRSRLRIVVPSIVFAAAVVILLFR